MPPLSPAGPLALLVFALAPAALAQPADLWIAAPEVVRGASDGATVRGTVFEDLDRDGRRSAAEPGVPGVMVSNGREVVRTDAAGAYALPARDDMDLTVVQPAGWRVPTTAARLPQFFYVHKPGGTPEALRYGGLPDTGPLPAAVHFPLVRDARGPGARCAVVGDSQTYSGAEVGHFRDSAVATLLQTGPWDCLLYVGDVAGDDLNLLPRLTEVGAAVGAPQQQVIFATHIPFVSFVDTRSAQHQTDNLADIHALVAGRPALSLSGHTHTTENHAPGQRFPGWAEALGIGPLPFRHLIAGAASGSWYQGDVDVYGVPMALQRMGAPKGVTELEIRGADVRERYLGSRLPTDQAMWVGFNSPTFRSWYDTLAAWAAQPEASRDSIPPVSAQDLPQAALLTRADLAGGTFLTANVWIGSAETRVEARIDGGAAQPLERTQAGAGEDARVGAEFACPVSTPRQATVARVAVRSRSGEPAAQGTWAFRGRQTGPTVPGPQGFAPPQNMHLWRLRLPADLPEGVHVAEVTSTDRHGRASVERIAFEVRETRPRATWDDTLWR